MRIVIVCLCVLFSISSGAMALPVTFDFSSASNSFEYSSSGLILEVLADSFDATGSLGGNVTWVGGSGLGVEASGKSDSSKTLDGSGSDDLLTFDFGTKVQLGEITFASVGSTDEVRLLVDGLTVFDDYLDSSLTTSLNLVTFDFSPLQLFSEKFSLLAIDTNDSFRIKSITVDYNQQSAPVPEPSTWLLLSTGMAGLVYWRRRY